MTRPTGQRGLVLAALLAILLPGCGARVELRQPSLAEAASGAATSVATTAITGGSLAVGAASGTAQSFVVVRPGVRSQFPGQRTWRLGCAELRDCYYRGGR